MMKRVDFVDQVMSWEVEAITARNFLKEAELSRGEDIANAVDEALAKFKSSKEFATLLKKDLDTGFNAELEVIFYNIWMHYPDLDYAFLGSELTDLIGEWIKEEKLNASDVVSPSVPFDPSTSNAAEIKSLPAKTSEQSSVVEAVEVTATPDPSIALEVVITEPSLRVTAVQSLINLDEEPVAADVEGEIEAATNPFIV